MKVKDLINNISQVDGLKDSIPEDMDLQCIGEEHLRTTEKIICVVDSEGNKIGEVDTWRLKYVTSHFHELPTLSLLDHFKEAIIIIDNEGRIFYINEAYKKIIGVKARKLIGRFICDVEGSALLFEVLKSREPMFMEKHFVKSVNKYVSLRMFPLYNGEKLIGAFSIFNDITEIDNLSNEVKRYSGIVEEYHREKETISKIKEYQIIGSSPNFKHVLNQAAIVAKTSAAVLINGSNGSGKEVITKLIHTKSERRNNPFITVNCSAIPESLIESELFGYEEGAFTGSRKGGQMGKFELANGGTIFLDEIGDMPLHMQAKLLRVLEQGDIEKIGRQKNVKVDVRVIAATNQNLLELIQAKKFREDLYYRLNVVNLTLPMLNERGDDIILLANHFLDSFCEKYSKRVAISDEAYRALLRYDWPGNVRELQNSIEHAVILCSESVITSAHLPERILGNNSSKMDTTTLINLNEEINLNYESIIAKTEKKLLEEVLTKTAGNKTKAMELLGLSRRTFYRKLKENKIVS